MSDSTFIVTKIIRIEVKVDLTDEENNEYRGRYRYNFNTQECTNDKDGGNMGSEFAKLVRAAIDKGVKNNRHEKETAK